MFVVFNGTRSATEKLELKERKKVIAIIKTSNVWIAVNDLIKKHNSIPFEFLHSLKILNWSYWEGEINSIKHLYHLFLWTIKNTVVIKMFMS